MDTLLHKFDGKIKGVIEGFDRIVIKGLLLPLCHAAGMQLFLMKQGVLNKDSKDWVQERSAIIIRDAEEYTQTRCGHEIEYLPSYHIRKEEAAHEQQKRRNIQSGMIGT